MSAKLCGIEQRAPPVFGRVTITLGIGPHSSFYLLQNIKKISLSCNLRISIQVQLPSFTAITQSWHCQLRTAGFCWSKVLLPACPRSWQLVRLVREIMQQFSSTVLPAPFPHHLQPSQYNMIYTSSITSSFSHFSYTASSI